MAEGPVPAAAAGQGGVTPPIKELPAEGAGNLRVPEGMRRPRMRLVRNSGDSTCESTEQGTAVSQALRRTLGKGRWICASLGTTGTSRIEHTAYTFIADGEREVSRPLAQVAGASGVESGRLQTRLLNASCSGGTACSTLETMSMTHTQVRSSNNGQRPGRTDFSDGS